jgi:ankyrin repeat protein
MAMGRRILRTVLDARASSVTSELVSSQVGIGDGHYYSLANILVEAIDEMVLFFSASGTMATTAASIADKGTESAAAAAGGHARSMEVDGLDDADSLREIYLDATASILAAHGADRIIELLADWGPFQNQNRERETPTTGSRVWLRLALMVTAYLGQVSELKALLQLPGADLALDPSSTPEEACDYLFPPLMSAGFGGYFNTVKVLMKAGVSLQSRNRFQGGKTLPCGVLDYRYSTDGENILHFAALGGHVKLVRFVLRESGDAAQAQAVDGRGYTPLMWALVSGQTAVARELLEWRDGDPVERKKEMMRNLKIEKKMIKKKKKQQRAAEIPRPSTPSSPDEDENEDEDEEPREPTTEADAQTLFRYALRSRNLDPVIDAFPGILEKEETLIAVAEWGTPEQLRHLLSVQQTPINYCSAAGATILHHAIYSGNREKVQMVLGQPGVDVNIRAAPDNGEETPLHAACRQTAEIVKLLLAHPDVDLLSLGSAGRTPLMDAVSWGRHDIFNLLLERSDAAEIWRKDFGGETIVSIAAFAQEEKLLRRLLDLAPAMDVVHEAISLIDEYLAGPKRLPKKLQYLWPIRIRQERIRKGTYSILVQYRQEMGG